MNFIQHMNIISGILHHKMRNYQEVVQKESMNSLI